MSVFWETRNVKLPFWLGEVCLFRKSFRLHTTNVDFINYDQNSPEHRMPAEIDSASDGVMLYSVPLEENHVTLWREESYVNYVSQAFRRYYIDLNCDYQTYLEQFSSKTRSTFRRKIRKFEKESGGTIDWRVYVNPTEMEEFHKLAREISKETYQEKLLDAGLPEDEGFLSDMRRHAREGSVRSFILFLDGKAVAYLYLPAYDGRIVYEHLGYLPEVARLSGGTVLFLKALEYLFDDDVAPVFDFTEGQSEQKKQFSTHNVYCANVFKLKATAPNIFWLRLHKMFNGLSSVIKSMLEAIGLKKFLKALLRR